MIAIEFSRFWDQFGYSFDDLKAFLLRFNYKIFISKLKSNEAKKVEKEYMFKQLLPNWDRKAFNVFAVVPQLHGNRIQNISPLND